VIYLVRMRPKFHAAAVALVLVGTLSASGCASEAPAADPTPTLSATPLFASDEEALAAAEEAYAAYLAVTDEIYAEGGAGSDRLASVAAGTLLEADSTGMADVAKLGYRSVGETKFDSFSLQSYSPNAADLKSIVVAYLCQDVSAVDVFDPSGSSVVSDDRPDRTRLEVTFDGLEDSRQLLVSNKVAWSDQTC